MLFSFQKIFIVVLPLLTMGKAPAQNKPGLLYKKTGMIYRVKINNAEAILTIASARKEN